MVKNLALWLLCILLFTGCNDVNRDERRLEYIEIINEGMISIVKIDVKGKIYTFLLDSGSPVSLIDSDLVQKNPNVFKIEKEETIKGQNYGFETRLFTELMSTRFYLHNFKSTQEKIFYHTQEHVDGVLGMDFLVRNKSIVNFDKAILTHLKKLN